VSRVWVSETLAVTDRSGAWAWLANRHPPPSFRRGLQSFSISVKWRRAEFGSSGGH